MVHDKKKLPMGKMFHVDFTIQMCQVHYGGDNDLSKNPKFYIWPKQRFLRSLAGFLEKVLSQHHFIRVLETR